MALVDHVEICAVNGISFSPCPASLHWWLCTLQFFLPHYIPGAAAFFFVKSQS